jgi:alpha-N-acetylglucosaminidase
MTLGVLRLSVCCSVLKICDKFCAGTNGMFGDLSNVADRVGRVGDDADATTLAGTGISMEGIDQNPVYYALVLDSLWQKSAAVSNRDGRTSRHSIDDVYAFIVDFGVRRCGKRLAKIETAWAILANTTFRRGGGVGLGHAYCSSECKRS